MTETSHTADQSAPVRDFDLLVIGELNVDLIIQGNVTPVFGQVESLIDDATLVLGSSSAIFACGAARLGLRVAFIGKVGDDAFGKFAVSQLAARNVDTSRVVVDPTLKTGISIIFSRSDDRAILTYLGTISALRFDEVDQSFLDRARHLHFGSYFLLNSLKPDIPKLCQIAHQRGLTTSFDTNYDPTERWEAESIMPSFDVFMPNRTELCAIMHEADLDRALEKAVQRTELVAVKLGADGALARRGGEVVQAGNIPVEVVDTTGAGDSFDAGFIYGYLSGWSLQESLSLGTVCGALSTRAAGGTAAQATFEEANAYLNR